VECTPRTRPNKNKKTVLEGHRAQFTGVKQDWLGAVKISSCVRWDTTVIGSN